MAVIERGDGWPLVLIPGLQGRWEYHEAAVRALADRCRVVTFPLCDEPSALAAFDRAHGLDDYVEQIRAALDGLHLQRAAICGISFGGIVALRFAARYPERTAALILTSTPGPDWHLRRKHEVYASAPWLLGPVFLAEAPARVGREIVLALAGTRARCAFVWGQLRTLVRAPLSFSRMAARARLIGGGDRAAECSRVQAPTLVVHGEPHLDHVVPVDGTTAYGRLIAGARTVRLERTGHLGTMTRPLEFAEVVTTFLCSLETELTASEMPFQAPAAGRAEQVPRVAAAG